MNPLPTPLSSTTAFSPLPETPLTTQSIDLFWRNRSTIGPMAGRNVLWGMAGPEYGGSFKDLTPVADANWSVAAVADYNRDGASDYLWRNQATGENLWWLMDAQGSAFTGFVRLTTVANPEWTIVGAADTNGDQQADLLWRNTKTGSNLWWIMQGDQIASVREIQSLNPVHADWEIKGVGDVDKDGEIDLFWSNRSTGTMALWLMKGGRIKESIDIEADVTGGKGQGFADFNNDGQLDIVLRNAATGENTLWIMDRGTVLDRYSLLTVNDPTWELDALVARNNRSPSSTPKLSKSPTDVVPPILKDSPKFFDRSSLTPKSASTGAEKTYSFTVKESGIFTANLTGLTQDSDVRLVQDANGNGRVDAGESVLALEWERGTVRESLRKFIQAGTYLVQVQNTSSQTALYSLSSNFTVAVSDALAFKIQLNYGIGTETLNGAARSAIAGAAQFWENAIVSRSAITKLKNLTIDIVGLAIREPNTLAYAGPLVTTDGVSLFISSAEATLNLSKYAIFNSDPAYLRRIMVHEFAHALGFGTLWVPIDVPSRGKIGQAWTDSTTATYRANSYAGYAYGNLIGIEGAVAVPLDRSDLSHWDETRFDAEFMTPYAEGSAVAMPVSALTLSAMRDLGWRVNLAVAEPYALRSFKPIV